MNHAHFTYLTSNAEYPPNNLLSSTKKNYLNTKCINKCNQKYQNSLKSSLKSKPFEKFMNSLKNMTNQLKIIILNLSLYSIHNKGTFIATTDLFILYFGAKIIACNVGICHSLYTKEIFYFQAWFGVERDNPPGWYCGRDGKPHPKYRGQSNLVLNI